MKRRKFIHQSAVVGLAGMVDIGPPSLISGEGFAQSDLLVIDGVSVFDSRAKQMRSDRSVVIRDDRIESVVGRGESNVPGARIIDGRGKYLIPGLIDAHVHLTHILYQSLMTGDEILPFFLANGVTTVRSAGDNVPAQRLVQRYSNEHPTTSPRVFTCSFLIGNTPPHHPDVGWSLTAPEQVPEFVAHMADWGVTTLKIYVNCLPAVGRAVIQEAHNHGLIVSGHLTSYHPADAVRDGIDCLEHIYTIADFIRADPDDRHSVDLDSDATKQLVDVIVQHGTFVDPTLMVFWGTLFFVDDAAVIDHPDNTPMPTRLLDFWRKDNPRRLESFSAGPIAVRRSTFQKYKDLVGTLHRAGARILVGTDAPEPQVPPGYSMHHEMEFLVESGLSPADVVSAATISNAQVLKQEHLLGSIEPGKLADIVMLDANPVENIANSRRIHRVIKGGRILDPEDILRSAPKH